MSSIPPLLPSTISNEHHDSFDDHPLFTPDLEYYTPPSTGTDVQQENTIPYQSHTLLSSMNKVRSTVLPMFLPSSFTTTDSIQEEDEDEPSLLLFTNVPIQQLNTRQKARRLTNAYQATFEFTSTHPQNPSNSFLASIYQQLLLDLSLRWNMNIYVLDYNLARLRTCANQCLKQLNDVNPCPGTTTTFTIEELPLALEFYLQIDVDLFYMKTCTFRQAQAIQQQQSTIFCCHEPQVRYGLTSCQQRSCPYCHPPTEDTKLTAIQFQSNQMHQFINGYQAILNCPVTCETSNIIYVLTCPCRQVDYIGYTSMSFRDCLAYHRQEGNRIMREFFIGGMTTNRILQGMKSDEAKRNDHRLLYQHSARCSVALQLFLDVHPDFWCLVPMKSDELLVSTTNSTISKSETTTTTTSHMYNKRLNASVKYFIDGLPKPPLGYLFSERQLNEQFDFFRHKKDQLQSTTTTNNIDLFQATIVAVLPENCSKMLCQFVTSLFVTHAECQLNEPNEKLIHEHVHRHYPFRGTWCENLIRPS